METLRLFGIAAMLGAISWIAPWLGLQSPADSPTIESGQIAVDGRNIPYRIRRLPVSSFPEIPLPIADALVTRGCLIPQTYEAKRPENVIHASLEAPGSSDWAVLCSDRGTVSLLVFFGSESALKPAVLAESEEKQRLQPHDPTGALGFNWGIDPASPRRVHDAQAGMTHRPPAPDHDSVADSIVEHETVFHLYRNGVWEKIDVD